MCDDLNFVFLQGIQHFGDAVLNPNKKPRDLEDSDINNPTIEATGYQQPHGIGPQDHQPGPISPNISRSASSNVIQNDYMVTKISDSSSTTQVLLL